MKTVLVTGASSGIGAACAVRLRDRGWRVLAGVRREAREALSNGGWSREELAEADMSFLDRAVLYEEAGRANVGASLFDDTAASEE